MQQYVCVRVIKANALDLSLFQFDYDLTFAAFLMNADRTIYGRFGTRSHRENVDDELTIQAFRLALARGLELHRGYPANREQLAGKQPRPVTIKTPEEFPALRGKYGPDLDYAGAVARSCIHCHQVREAERQLHRTEQGRISDQVLFPYPQPDVAGLRLDPTQVARVTEVLPGSSAERAGIRAGDDIRTLKGQPILSIADVQWVLHQAADADSLAVEISRAGNRLQLTLPLAKGWRRASDLAWRATTWDLRRMGTGGLVLEDLPADARRPLGLPETALALLVKHVGQFGEHAAGKQAGFQKSDVVVAADGRRDRLTESELLAYAVQQKRPGEPLSLVVLRNGRELTLTLPVR